MAELAASSNATASCREFLNKLTVALKQRGSPKACLPAVDLAIVASLFQDECYWRDFLAASWRLVTCDGRGDIKKLMDHALLHTHLSHFAMDGEGMVSTEGTTDGFFTFETATGRGRGHMRLKEGEDGVMRAWTLMTELMELKGHEEQVGDARIVGAPNVVIRGATTWLERRERELKELGLSPTFQPYCLIIGGGQSGLALGARLRHLHVPCIILDRRACPGDTWRSRYRYLDLHDPSEFQHLPYIPFPAGWPRYPSKDKVGDWMEMYCKAWLATSPVLNVLSSIPMMPLTNLNLKVMELNYWGGCEATGASYDSASKTWAVSVKRQGEKVTLYPTQLVLACGLAGLPKVPKLDGMDKFGGDSMHSSQFQTGKAWAGKNCVVVGSGNSAHDICTDLWREGASRVTMVQRSSTCVIPRDSFVETLILPLYSEEAVATGVTRGKADMMFFSLPFKVVTEIHKKVTEGFKRDHKDLYDGLRKAGMHLDFGEDESGMFLKYIRNGSGYYFDVGASQLIIDREIKVKHGSVGSIAPGAVVMKDGDKLPADLIVFATGYARLEQLVENLISKEVAEKLGPCWGYGSGTSGDPLPYVGELRNMWCPTAQEGLWLMGGNFLQCRFHSLHVALQIKARMEGVPTPIFNSKV